MKKMPTLFLRDPDNRSRLLRAYHPDAVWVAMGEGIATVKFDGTCVLRDAHALWWVRREVKPGKQPPPNFILVDQDANTGKTMGWEPAEQSGYHQALLQALSAPYAADFPVGTYELVGPKVNGNPHRLIRHELWKHGSVEQLEVPRTYEELDDYLRDFSYEGIVWHHEDGRRAKIKKRDFGHPWPIDKIDTEVPEDALTDTEAQA